MTASFLIEMIFFLANVSYATVRALRLTFRNQCFKVSQTLPLQRLLNYRGFNLFTLVRNTKVLQILKNLQSFPKIKNLNIKIPWHFLLHSPHQKSTRIYPCEFSTLNVFICQLETKEQRSTPKWSYS